MRFFRVPQFVFGECVVDGCSGYAEPYSRAHSLTVWALGTCSIASFAASVQLYRYATFCKHHRSSLVNVLLEVALLACFFVFSFFVRLLLISRAVQSEQVSVRNLIRKGTELSNVDIQGPVHAVAF